MDQEEVTRARASGIMYAGTTELEICTAGDLFGLEGRQRRGRYEFGESS